jgi:thioredoxin-like negative regulator of GroEL
MRAILIYSGLLLVVAVATQAGPVTPVATPRPEVAALEPEQLSAALATRTWLIVEFGGERCIPCMHMQPVLQDLQAALGKKARVHNFWIQKYPEVARQHKIMVMPTQVIFNPKGEEVFRHMGYFPPDEFHATLQKLGLF